MAQATIFVVSSSVISDSMRAHPRRADRLRHSMPRWRPMVAEFKGASWKIRDPKLVVRKAARVARPGGTVVIFDADYATMTSGVDREMDERIISGVIANPRVMRACARSDSNWSIAGPGCLQRSGEPTSFVPCSHIPSSCRRQAERLLRRPKHLSPDSCVQAKKARFSLDTISMQ